MKLPLLIFLIALLPACAATHSGEGAPQGVGTDACVFQSSITGFKPLDDSRVILYGRGGKDAYLAVMTLGCFDLAQQTQLAAIDGDGNGQICGYGRDNIAYQTFGRTESCRVTTLRRLTEEQLAAALEKKTKKPRKVLIE